MAQGGPRQGTPGAGYGNRTDLMANRAPVQPGQVDPTAAGGQQPPQQRSFTRPDDIPTLRDPSSDGRPVTHGMDLGPGAGSEALGALPVTQDRTLEVLRALYAQNGSEHIRRLIAQHQLAGS